MTIPPNLLKNARIAKGYTQAELAALTKISLRSIQRIENGAVTPRTFTLKLLAEKLELNFETINSNPVSPLIPVKNQFNLVRKIILSITLGLVIFLLSAAFLSQSAKFPETNFEYFLFWCGVVLFYGLLLLRIWRSSRR